MELKVVWVLCLAASGMVGACGDSDGDRPGPKHSTHFGAGGDFGAAACPRTLLDRASCGEEGGDAAGGAPGERVTDLVAPVRAGLGGLGTDGGVGGSGGESQKGGSGSGVAGEGGAGAVGGVGVGAVAGEGGIGGSAANATRIVLLALDQRPYTECKVYKAGATYEHDADGIPLKLYRNELHYNPVLTAQAGLEWLACYRESQDAAYLELARKAGRQLVTTSVDVDGAMFFPYDFDFSLHHTSDVEYAPWYSGMAQGQVLSLFSRLGELTSDVEWELAAAATLKSFDRVHGEAYPWIIEVDEQNSVWIEEYPFAPATHALNGFIFAMFGLYDYFAWRQDAHAAEMFAQTVDTLRLNVERFRNPGGISAYCLKHREQSASYHAIHIAQLRAITRMTDEPYFASVADLFAADFSE